MPRCKNCDCCYYTGKENTPRGRGYSAKHEKIEKRMKNKENRMYSVVSTKSGKRWQKVDRVTSPRGLFGGGWKWNGMSFNSRMLGGYDFIDTQTKISIYMYYQDGKLSVLEVKYKGKQVPLLFEKGVGGLGERIDIDQLLDKIDEGNLSLFSIRVNQFIEKFHDQIYEKGSRRDKAYLTTLGALAAQMDINNVTGERVIGY
jgi:hypothetical protein